MSASGGLAAPLVPPDCDLRDLPSIMLQRSIATSELAMMSTGDEFKAAILLYEASYDQTPAGSLPTDDRALSFLSRAGPKWAKVKSMALRGWFECSDGRLYHRITAEKVLIAWIGRLKQRQAAKAGGAKKNNSDSFDPLPIQAQINVALDCLARVAPDCRELAKWRRAGSGAGGTAGGSAGGSAGRTASAVPSQCQAEGEAEGKEKGPSQNSGEIVHLGSARAGAAA